MVTPIPLLTAQQMRACDQYAIEKREIPSQILMERAAHAVVEAMQDQHKGALCAGKKVVVLCGSGNNGGDGFAVAEGRIGQLFLCYAHFSALRHVPGGL